MTARDWARSFDGASLMGGRVSVADAKLIAALLRAAADVADALDQIAIGLLTRGIEMPQEAERRLAAFRAAEEGE